MSRGYILLNNFNQVRAALQAACSRAGRDPRTVTLLTVTKYAQDPDVLFLLEQGVISDIGESRVQQACNRWQDNPAFARFRHIQKHFIGHLQKNKAPKAAQLFDWIDSLDDYQTAALISRHAPCGKVLRGLVQVKLTDRDTQSGLPLNEARQLARQLRGAFDNLEVCGYMAVAPQGAEPGLLRTLFKQVNQAFVQDFAAQEHAQLSLGMSDDFEIAVEEGSTLPRIGSLLFSNHLEGV